MDALSNVEITIMTEETGRLYAATSTIDNQPVLLNNKCVFGVTDGMQTVLIGQIGQTLTRKKPAYILGNAALAEKDTF